MKKQLLILSLTITLTITTFQAQNVGINATGSSPNASAGLDVDFSNKGLLIPRVALASATDVATIPSPASSLLVYNNGSGGLTPAGYYYWDGSKWVKLITNSGTPSDAWLTTGNSGTSPSSNFIGTIDNTSLVFRTNNTEQMRLHNTGQLSIGDNTPGGKLDVHQTSSNDVARFTTYGNVNSILLRRTQGTKTSPSPTSGAGTVLGRFDAQGYDGSGFTTAARIEMATDATGGTSTDMPGRITFWTTPDNSGTLQERMRITNNGNVGIGTTTPGAKLEVTGISHFATAVNTQTAGPANIRLGADAANNDIEIGSFNPNISDLSFWNPSSGSMMNITAQNALFAGNRVTIGMATTGTHLLQLSADDAAKPSTNTWIIISDERLKNITGKYNKGLKEILQLNPITYYYKNTSDYKFDPKALEKENIGFSAQQVSKIFPEAVAQDPNGYLSFNIHPILVAYVNAIKELDAKNKELEKKVEMLEKELSNLKSHIGITAEK